jgi:hypothetical protein
MISAIFSYLPSFIPMDSATFLVRFNGEWKSITTRPFEPERMTTDIAWIQIKEELTPQEAYVKWFETQRNISRILQQ